MRSALFRLAARPTHPDPDTGRTRPATDREMKGWGFRLVGEIDGDEVWHAAPGVDLPEGATVLRDGREDWAWSGLKDDLPDVAQATLHAVWNDGEDEDGRPIRRRGRQGPARGRGDIPSALAEDLPPHHWQGDDE